MTTPSDPHTPADPHDPRTQLDPWTAPPVADAPPAPALSPVPAGTGESACAPACAGAAGSRLSAGDVLAPAVPDDAHALSPGASGQLSSGPAQEPLTALPVEDEAVTRIRAALDDADTPIAAAAAAAVQVLNPSGSDDFPRPTSRRVITIANQKGGVGKTTSTVNLGVALALHGMNVLVIDLDPQGNASTGLGVPHHAGVPNVYDVLVEGTPIADVAQPAAGVPRLMCVPATIDLAGAEIELVSMVARESRLKRAIDAYCDEQGKDVDYVLVDCPPSLGLLTLNAMVATGEVLIPIQCEYYALEGLGQLLKTIELVRANLNPTLEVSTILLTMYDARTRLAEQVADEVRSHFGSTVLDTAVPRSVRVSEAPGYGQSVVTYDAGSRGAKAYLDAAREIANRGVTA